MKDSFLIGDDGLPSIIRGVVRIDWTNLDEGYDGDYDPENPDDVNLLRFDVSVANLDKSSWEEVEDGSYCTQVPAHTHPETLKRILVSFMDYIYDDIVSVQKSKRKCEQLSWTSPDGNIQINSMDNIFS